jgi:serine/threonine-protein kinase
MIGTTVGKYRILGRLGRGGMGIVYKALDETLDREVAIKVLNSDVTDAELLKRFRAEAVSLARLNHPNIATIYELHRHQDELLMVMEFVRGESLQSLSERTGPFDPAQAAYICVQILEALAHAHRAGIVHRDLKPANVMVTETGAVKIMDFGIARVLGGEHLTHAGFMMGTPAYMAPEQVLGQEVDGRADLYSVGVIFYRLLSRELPFQADTAIGMAQKQVAETPTPLAAFRPHLPEWCEALITKALAKAPGERFQSAEAFRAAILATVAPEPLGELPTMATPMPPGLARPTDLTVPYPGTAAATRTPAHASSRAADDRDADGSSWSTPISTEAPLRTSGTATSPVERTGTTVVLGRGHLLALVGVLLALVAGIAALGLVAFMRTGPSAPITESPSAEPTGTTPSAGGAVSEPAPVPVAETDPASAPPAAPPGPPAAATPPKPPTPSGGERSVPPSASTRLAERPKPDPKAALPEPPATAAAGVPEPSESAMAPITFRGIKVLMRQGGALRDRDAVLTFASDGLTVLERDGTTVITALPYTSIVQAFYSRSRQPRWAGPDGSTVEPQVDRGRFGFLRGEGNWLVFTTGREPVVVRVEDGQLQRALAALQQRGGLTVRRMPGRPPSR